MRATSRYLRSATLLTLLALAVVPARAWAASVSPTVTVESTGRSAFVYGDLHDEAPKFEGGYAAYDGDLPGTYKNPHGGYDTTTNKCSVCHAVHRSEDSYYLMRGETQADSCAYCHAGSGHAKTIVYDQPGGLHAEVGHAMGAGPDIPASAVSVSLETTTVSAIDASGTPTTATVTVRDVGKPNRMFRLSRQHSQSPSGELRSGYQRLGPTLLTCLSCHQPHNATYEVWRPRAYPANDATLSAGYKLLRASPSGSIWGPDDMAYGNGGPATVSYTKDGMLGYKSYSNFNTTGLVNSENTIRAVESTLTTATTGEGKTIWRSAGIGAGESAEATPSSTVYGVNQYALSAWCADCHNLAMGGASGGSATTTVTVEAAPTTLLAMDDASASTSETAFTQLKQLHVDLTGKSVLRIKSDAKIETSGTADLKIDVPGATSVTHSVTATDFQSFDETMPLAGVGETTVTLSLKSDGDAASNEKFELYVGATSTLQKDLAFDMSVPAHETSRTHSVPFSGGGNGPAQCYTCHRGGLSAVPEKSGYDDSKAECEQCHYGTGSYATDPQRASGASDWPHSAEASAAYMLGAWTVDASGSVVATAIPKEPSLIQASVCVRCHPAGGGRHHDTTPTP